MIATIRLDHVAIAANNTETLVAWYQKVMGFQIYIETGPIPPQTQKVFLIGPPDEELPLPTVKTGMMIEVMPRNDTPRHNRNSHEPGWSHTAWAVADFDAALTHLKACNVKFLSEVIQAVGGGRIISFEDCEGNMTQIVERL